MTVTTQRTTDPTTATATTGPQVTDRPVVEKNHHRGLIALVGGLAVVTAATLGTWAWVATRPAPLTLDAAGSEAYGPGSSTYDGQVPDGAAGAARSTAWTSAYGPSSTVFGEQVPSSAVAAARMREWMAAYGPGTAVYDEQVPDSLPAQGDWSSY